MHPIDLFARAAARYADRPCLHDGGETFFTFRQTLALMWKTVRAIRAERLPAEAGVAILSPNDISAYVCVMAAERSGHARLQLSLRDAPELIAQVLRFNDCGLVIYHSSQAPLVAHLKGALPTCRRYVCLDRANAGDSFWLDWLDPHPESDPGDVVGPDDIVLRASTGGTTGLPKTVMHPRRLLQLVALNTTWYCFPHQGPAIHLAFAPTTHAAGQLCYPALLSGGLNVMMPNPDLARVPDLVERFRVSMMFMPPTAIYMLLQQPGLDRRDFSTLKYFAYAAAPMAVQKLKDALQIFGPVMAQFYAQTEAGMPLTWLGPEEHLVGPEQQGRLASCGRPTPWSDLAIMDESGRLLGPGERGEIVCRGDQVMKGYYKNPEATAAVSQHGWHHTGDVGYVDADGYYYVVDRTKDMIITGGFNVYPAEVEQAVLAHPAVQDAAVIGAPDEKWGEAVTAVVQLKPGATLLAEDLIAFCRARLGSVQTPKRVEIWPDLPRSPVGKVLKREIRKPFWEGRDRQV